MGIGAGGEGLAMKATKWLVTSVGLCGIVGLVWFVLGRGNGGAIGPGPDTVLPGILAERARSDTVAGGITSIGENLWWVEFVVESAIGGVVTMVEITEERRESQAIVVVNGTMTQGGGEGGTPTTRAWIRRLRGYGSRDTIVVAIPSCEPLAVSVVESERVEGGAEVRREVVVDYNQVVPLAVVALGDVESQVTTAEAPNVLADSVIEFEFDDDSVRGERVDVVRELSRLLNERRELVIWVEGHTDSIGDAVYNRSLGMRRAEAVSEVLFQEGIDSSRIVLSSAGEGQSRGSDLSSDRRAELLIRPCPVEEEDGRDGIAGEVANDDGEMMGPGPSEAATGQAIESFVRHSS